MATISFEAYVHERRGKMLRVSEEYRAKDETGQWGHAGYGDFTVWLRDDDVQPEVQAGAVVLITGDLRVKKVEKEGRTYTNLNVSFAKVGIVKTTKHYAGSPQQPAGGTQTSSWSPSGFGPGEATQQAQGQADWSASSGPQWLGGSNDPAPF